MKSPKQSDLDAVRANKKLWCCGKFEAKQNLRLSRTLSTVKEKIAVSTKKFPNNKVSLYAFAVRGWRIPCPFCLFFGREPNSIFFLNLFSTTAPWKMVLCAIF